MPSGPYERFYPGEDKGLLDPTWGGGPYRLSAPSISHKGSAMALGLLGGTAAGYGAKLGYQGIVRGGQALDRILPALKSIAKKGIPVWGEGVLDYGVGKQTEEEVEKVVEKVKERREPEPVSRLKTGRVPQLGSSNLTSASWYSRAEDAVLNAKQRRGTVDQWVSEIGRGGGKKELNMTGGLDALKKAEGVLNKSEVLGLLQPYTIRLEEKYYTSPHRAEGRFPEPRWADIERINLQGYNLGNPVEIVLSFPDSDADRAIQTVDELVRSWGPTRQSGNFQDSDWPGVLNPVVHIRGNDGKLFNLPAFIIQEIQSNWHQSGQADGYRQPMIEPDDIEIKTVSVDEAMSDKYRDNYPGYTNNWMDKTDLRDWRAHQNVPVDAPVTLYKLKSAETVESDGVVSGWQMHPQPNITANELWNIEFDLYSMDQTDPDDPFYEAWAAGSSSRVPDAPYKKTWHELGFKRALMEALRDPNKEYLAWTTGEVQAERAFGENWEVDWPEKSQFHLKLYNEKIVRFAKKLLGVTPQKLEPRGWNVFVPGTGSVVKFFESEQEAKDYSDLYNDEYERSESELWYIKINEEMRDKFIKVLEDEVLGAPEEVQMPLAQKEGGGLLGSYA